MATEIEFQRAFDSLRNATELTLYILVASLWHEKGQNEFGKKLRELANRVEADATSPACDTAMIRRLAGFLDGTTPAPWTPKVIQGGKTD